jgi:hypothetical protein
MRRRITTTCLGAVFVLAALQSAFAISNLTESQVRSVCGSDLKPSPGHFGCIKPCADKTSKCIYDCSEKTKICSGVALGGNSSTPAKDASAKDTSAKPPSGSKKH